MSSRSTSPVSTTSSFSDALSSSPPLSSSSHTLKPSVPPSPAQAITSLTSLILAIRTFLGPTSGLDCAEVDHDALVRLMQNYHSDARDWARYAFADPSRNYTRNFVDDTNAKSNILVVVWNPGKASPIHDHANAHCIMKVLQGTLTEQLYHPPLPSHNDSSSSSNDKSAPQLFRTTTYTTNQTTYISDSIGLHRISNPSQTDYAVSLHLYTPPHAHHRGMNIFDERTGRSIHVNGAVYFSERGEVKRSCLSSSPSALSSASSTP